MSQIFWQTTLYGRSQDCYCRLRVRSTDGTASESTTRRHQRRGELQRLEPGNIDLHGTEDKDELELVVASILSSRAVMCVKPLSPRPVHPSECRARRHKDLHA
jgi:hypothetical protein